MRLREPANIVPGIPLQENSNRVLTVGREVVANRNSATRAKRQILAHAIVLHEELMNLVLLRERTGPRFSYRQTSDLARRRHVPFEQHRRHREGVTDVVKPMVHFVDGKQQFAVDVDRKQVADHVGVFGAIEAMDSRPAGIGIRSGGTVERRLQIGDQRVIAGRVRAWSARGRHRARSKLVHHLFPDCSTFAGILDIRLVQHESCCSGSLIVARDAVSIQKGAVRGGGRRNWV